ncbi:MAG: hypothetical protein JSR73_07735 [Proteobacteria bacterium]|nr:hypothetical protein [Pseudomonadota bacterium]
MLSLSALWLPILAAAVTVFVLSSLIHMLIGWHRHDHRGLANEDEVRAALRAAALPPGEYLFPHCPDMKAAREPPFLEKLRTGPVGLLVIRPNGEFRMGKLLGLWFVYLLGVCVLTGYLTARLGTGAAGVDVFRVASIAAFLAFGGGSVHAGIWWGKPWSNVLRDLGDAAIYGAGTGAAFCLLWPH